MGVMEDKLKQLESQLRDAQFSCDPLGKISKLSDHIMEHKRMIEKQQLESDSYRSQLNQHDQAAQKQWVSQALKPRKGYQSPWHPIDFEEENKPGVVVSLEKKIRGLEAEVEYLKARLAGKIDADDDLKAVIKNFTLVM